MPAISVIVPMYNARRTIARCVDSVRAQTFLDFELIIVDNNSRDDCARTAAEYAREDARVRLVAEPRQGVSAARNCGLAHATGAYVTFLDADDALSPDALERLYGQARAGDCDLVTPGVLHVRLDARGAERSRFSHELRAMRFENREAFAREFAERLPRYDFFHVYMLYRRALIERLALRFDEALSLGEDLQFNVAFYAHINRAAVLDAPTYIYYHNYGESLNTRYREGLIAEKRRIFAAIRGFLESQRAWDERARAAFDAMYAQEAFALVSNAFRDPAYTRDKARAEVLRVCEMPETRALVSAKRLQLSMPKRLFVYALAARSFALARVSVRASERLR